METKTPTPKVQAQPVAKVIESIENSLEVVKKERVELTGNALKVRNAFKKIYSVSKGGLSFRNATDVKAEEVQEQKRSGKTFEKGSLEAQKISTENFYATITSKIVRNGSEEKMNGAIEAIKAFVVKTTIKPSKEVSEESAKVLTLENQRKTGQEVLDAIMLIFKGDKSSGLKKNVSALTIEDIFA